MKKLMMIFTMGFIAIAMFAANQKKAKIPTGQFGDINVDYKNKRIKISNKVFETVLDGSRNFSITSLSSSKFPKANLIPRLFLSVSQEGQKSTNEYYSQIIKSEPSAEDAGGKFVVKINETWPALNLIKTIEFYGNEPYIHLRYDIEISKDFNAKRLALILKSGISTNILCYHNKTRAVFRKLSKKGKWFSFPKDNEKRWVGFYSEKNSAGFSIVGADAANWKEYSSRPLGVELGSGGFGFGLELYTGKRELRKGDKLYFDIFLYIFDEKPVEKTSNFLNVLSGGN